MRWPLRSSAHTPSGPCSPDTSCTSGWTKTTKRQGRTTCRRTMSAAGGPWARRERRSHGRRTRISGIGSWRRSPRGRQPSPSCAGRRLRTPTPPTSKFRGETVAALVWPGFSRSFPKSASSLAAGRQTATGAPTTGDRRLSASSYTRRRTFPTGPRIYFRP